MGVIRADFVRVRLICYRMIYEKLTIQVLMLLERLKLDNLSHHTDQNIQHEKISKIIIKPKQYFIVFLLF